MIEGRAVRARRGGSMTYRDQRHHAARERADGSCPTDDAELPEARGQRDPGVGAGRESPGENRHHV